MKAYGGRAARMLEYSLVRREKDSSIRRPGLLAVKRFVQGGRYVGKVGIEVSQVL